jgi:thymidylate kinase
MGARAAQDSGQHAPSLAENGRPNRQPVNLLLKLSEALTQDDISCRRRDSDTAFDGSAEGDGDDVDLLVNRPDLLRIAVVLHRFGFKRTKPPADKRLSGVLDFCGYDEEADKLIHVRVHVPRSVGHQANARRALPIELCLRLWRGAASAVRRRIFKAQSRHRLESGGALIAIVGGDGAGKSTVVDALLAWLSEHFVTTTAHLGKPAWSWTTTTVRGILKLGQLCGLYPAEASFQATLNQRSFLSPGYPWLLREVCRARDRYWTYVKAQRFSANGGLVILDRFPLPQIRLMDGPQGERFLTQLTNGPQAGQRLTPRRAHRLARLLVRLEEGYYKQIVAPELIMVLRVDPEIAVQRRTGEDPNAVRERSTEIWKLDWEGTDVRVIDASKSKAAVLSEAKALIWSEI